MSIENEKENLDFGICRIKFIHFNKEGSKPIHTCHFELDSESILDPETLRLHSGRASSG